MNTSQEIKLILVALAEYLQTQLSDVQLLMYSRELEPIGIEGVKRAIALLREDPNVWPGKFPLPGKIKSYLAINPDTLAMETALNIFNIVGQYSFGQFNEAKKLFTEHELAVVRFYGWARLQNMSSDDFNIHFSMIKNISKTLFAKEMRERNDKLKIIDNQINAGESKNRELDGKNQTLTGLEGGKRGDGVHAGTNLWPDESNRYPYETT